MDATNNDINDVAQVMSHLSDWAKTRSEQNLARLAILNASNDDLVHTVLEHAIYNKDLNGAVMEEAAMMIQLADKKTYRKLRKARGSPPEAQQGISNEYRSIFRQPVDAIRTVLTQSKGVASFPPDVILLDTCSKE